MGMGRTGGVLWASHELGECLVDVRDVRYISVTETMCGMGS